MENDPLVTALMRPEAYPVPSDEVGFLETHISRLFFVGERVYKVKKAVDLGFLDFTTLERRQFFCDEEVRLNRRLAEGVYLGVVPIARGADGALRVGGDGDVVEWAVEMVRLPEHRMLPALLDRGVIDNSGMNELAALLTEFHAAAPTGEGVDRHGSVETITALVEENFDQLAPFVAASGAGAPILSETQIEFSRARAREFLTTNRELLAQRVASGRIRDGHGDLHAGNICFTKSGIVAYDCLEFSPEYRCGDVASDLAFLAMDLDYRGYPAFSGYLVKRYEKASGDDDVKSLNRFYKGYRATVRGKVAALTAADPSFPEEQREEKRREAMRYLQLAAAYELPPALVLMCGLPACGKSWLAERLALPLRAVVLHSDVRRKTAAGIRPTTRMSEGQDEGLYSPENKRATYRSLLESALSSVQHGTTAIVDATFSKREYRSEFTDAAGRLGLPCYVVQVSASDAVTRARLAVRAHDPEAISDADLDVYLAARSSFEPPDELPEERRVEVESTDESPAEEGISTVLDRMIES